MITDCISMKTNALLATVTAKAGYTNAEKRDFSEHGGHVPGLCLSYRLWCLLDVGTHENDIFTGIAPGSRHFRMYCDYQFSTSKTLECDCTASSKISDNTL